MSSARWGEKKRFSRPSRSTSATFSRTRSSSVRLQLEQLVVEALLLEAGADAGSQEDRVERLRQVVRRAQLDAADDALQLVHGRDHDHGDGPQPVVGLELLQHLVAVDLRHHDVQQNEVERARSQQLQRLATVPRGADVRVPLTAEALGQGVEVVLVVVDDEQRRPVLAHRAAQ